MGLAVIQHLLGPAERRVGPVEHPARPLPDRVKAVGRPLPDDDRPGVEIILDLFLPDPHDQPAGDPAQEESFQHVGSSSFLQRNTTHAILRGVTRSHVTVTGGVRIHYRRLGSGPPIVLLHGFPQTGHCWRKVMPALAARFTVVAPDLRGYGDSDRPPSGYDKRRMAADVAELIQTLALAPVVLVGHDRGGGVAPRLALRHPPPLLPL